MKENDKTIQCVSCNQTFAGSFCSNCGEPQLNPKHRSVKYLLSDLVESFTSLENRLLKTSWSFLRHPGELSLNYSIGKRVEYMKPVTFFLLINLVYVLITPLSDFSVSFYDQLNSQSYSPILKVWAMEYIESNQLDLKLIREDYQQVTAVLSRSLIIISAPLLALFIAIIYRSKNSLFVDHLVFSIYFYAWIMVWIVLAQIPAFALSALSKIELFDFISGMIYFDLLMLGLIVYLTIASKVAYKFSWPAIILRVPFAMAAVVISHILYRLVQFIISFVVVILEINPT